MTPHSLAPAFVRYDISSAFAPHVMLLPTRAWSTTDITGVMGSYTGWDGAGTDAEAMIDDLVVSMALQLKSTSTIQTATIYTQAGAHDPALPVVSKIIGTVGSNAVGGPDKATQLTLNMRTAGIGQAKMVFLDVPVGTSNFNKVLPADFSAALIAIFASLHSDTHAWAGRDDTQIVTPISATITLNERLRREYKMA